jgi:hypothetical protein
MAQRRESAEEDRPFALDARAVRRIRQAELVGQDEERLLRDRCDLYDDAVVPLRVLFDEQAEYQPVWPVNLQVFARVLDLLSAPVTHDPESSADPRLDLGADCVPREQNGARLGGIEQCIKDTLGHSADSTADAHTGGTQRQARGTQGSAREVHDPILLRTRWSAVES